MCEGSLYTLLFDIKTNRSLFLDLVHEFSRLLKKYAKFLGYEDAYNDLQLELFEVIIKTDFGKMENHSNGAIMNYMDTTLMRCYFVLSKKQNKYNRANAFIIDDAMSCEGHYVRESMATVDEYFETDSKHLRTYLTENEYLIIVHHYYLDRSINQIAMEQNISRQAVNQRKVNALKKLRAVFLL